MRGGHHWALKWGGDGRAHCTRCEHIDKRHVFASPDEPWSQTDYAPRYTNLAADHESPTTRYDDSQTGDLIAAVIEIATDCSSSNSSDDSSSSSADWSSSDSDSGSGFGGGGASGDF